MRLLIVNPNSTAAMTDRIGQEARCHLPGDVELSVRTNVSGPASIQGAVDGKLAIPGTLEILSQESFDAAVIGCFDDTGLTEINATGARCVVGLGEAAYDAAARTGRRFAVLTTAELSVPVLEQNMQSYGLGTNCVCIRASTIDVLDFEQDRESATHRLISAGGSLLKDFPKIETMVLGCAGMGGLARTLEMTLGIRVIDPIRSSVELAVSRYEMAP